MINFDDVTKENIKDYNPNQVQISDYLYRILIVGGSGSGKTNSLLNLISHQSDSTDLKHLNYHKTFMEHSIDIDNIYKNIEEYNPTKKRKILIVLDDRIANMLSNKELNPVVTELFIKRQKT